MPEISRFLGVVIAMYYNEHAPPHFHAKYGSHRAAFAIDDLRMIEGNLPHREDLKENWHRGERREKLQKIEPLV